MERVYYKQEKEVNFKNVKKVVVQFERRMSIEIERQKNSYKREKRDFRGELPSKYAYYNLGLKVKMKGILLYWIT